MAEIITQEDRINEILQRRIARDPDDEGVLVGVFPSQLGAVKEFFSVNKQRVFYFGIDPTGPQLHIGHTVPVLFLKNLAQLGHKVVIVIGDFTAQIGDPTGKDAARTALTKDEVLQNAATYKKQLRKIFGDVEFDMVHNSAWLESMNLQDVIKLASQTTVQQMLARDMFQERIKQERPIYMHEFLYPLMQGYDSVALKVDGEVGGNDQMFNMIVGRHLEKAYGITVEGKDGTDIGKQIFATQLLVNPATGKKMSKSEGSLIALDDSPQEIRRKVLDVDDSMTETIFRLCTEKPLEWISQRQKDIASGENPRQFKEELADELIRMYHGEDAVQLKAEPVPSVVVLETGETRTLVEMIKENENKSTTEAKALITQGAVSINDAVIKEWNHSVEKGDIIGIGKGKKIRI